MAGSKPRRYRWSVGAYLIWVVLAALVPALLIQYSANLDRREEARRTACAQALDLADDLAARQDEIAMSARQMLTALSFLPEVQRRDGRRLTPLLKAFHQQDPRFADLFALDLQGRAFASSNAILSTTAADRKYFQEALRTRRFAIGEFVTGRSTHTPTLHFAMPVLDAQGRVQAVLAAAYDLSQYGGVFNRSSLPHGTSLTLLDHRGTVLFHLQGRGETPGPAPGERIPTTQWNRLERGGQTGTYWEASPRGEKALLAYRKASAAQAASPYLVVLVERPESEVLAAGEAAYRRGSILLAVTGLLALLTAWAVGHRLIATPIRRLAGLSRQFGQGQLDLRPTLRRTPKEVAELAEELGRMGGELARREEERLRVESALQEAQKMESLCRLAGGIAHGFNNLLTVVLGNLNMAQTAAPEASVRRSLDQAEKAVMKASDLARQLMAFSGRGHFVVKLHDLNQVVEKAGHLLQVSVSRGISLRFALGEDVPAIRADAAQVQQMLVNLVVNASEAIGNRPGSVLIRTGADCLDSGTGARLDPSRPLAPGHYAVLEVSDTGCGMSEEILSRIFEPFFSTKPAGHGLGLSALHGIIRAHQGGLQVETARGKGSTFRLLFPADPVGLHPAASEDSKVPPRFQGMALVADDEPMVREFAVAALEAVGFQVVEARDGLEAVAKVHQHPGIRLVLLDIAMPRMDGLEAFGLLREQDPDLPIVLTSGYDQDATALSLMEQGLVQFLPKPYQMKDLHRTVAQALEGAEARVLTGSAP